MIWLSRIRHCRGFGVQSPTDYRFVRYVINEHYPYYRYAELADELQVHDMDVRKYCELFFRLSNFVQSCYFIHFFPESDIVDRYVTAACSKTTVVRIDNQNTAIQFNDAGPLLIRISFHPGIEKYADEFMSHAADGTIIVVDDIKQNKTVWNYWQSLTQCKRVGAAYDLYYCGIIIIDNRRYKKKYIINF